MQNLQKLAIPISIICIALLLFVIKYPTLLLKESTSEFRNLFFGGNVVSKYIRKENGEKTHTVILSDSTKYVLPRLDIDEDIEVGDSIIKAKWTYEIIIYKKANPHDKIIYALPFAQ